MRWLWAIVCTTLLALGTPASAHRLDEYLQETILSVERDRVRAEITLTPGVAVFRSVFAQIDLNRDGVLSAAEQHLYAERVRDDLSITMKGEKGERLPLREVSWKFAPTAELKAGRGNIRLVFTAEVPRGDASHTLVFENHHQRRVAAYLVNCLVSRDPDIGIIAQRRNADQSRYELDYVQTPGRSGSSASVGKSSVREWKGLILLLLVAPFAWGWHRAQFGKSASGQARACANERRE